jgi:hypothetical protein
MNEATKTRIIDLHRKIMSAPAIARATGEDVESVRRVLIDAGIKRTANRVHDFEGPRCLMGPTLADCLDVIAAKHSLSVDDLRGRDHSAREARREAVRLARELGYSWGQLGVRFGWRSPQTMREIAHGGRMRRGF